MARGKIRERIKRGLATQRATDGSDSNTNSDGRDTNADEPIVDVAGDSAGDTGEQPASPVAISPADLTGDGDDAGTGTGKKRGRKPGSKNRNKETPEDLTRLLYSIHLMGAALTSSPEVALTEEQANELGAAIARVNEVYGGVVVPERVMCLVNLGIVGARIYVPKVVTIARRKRQRPQVVPMPQVAQPTPTPENVN